MPAATPTRPSGAPHRISSPIQRQEARSVRRTSQRCRPCGSRWASAPSPISSSTPSARSTSTGHRWSSPRSPRFTGCPACAGGRFGFPGELAESKATMCLTHLRQADSVINRRLARANASNPDGWAAIAAASLAIDQPHLPHGLAGRLPCASSIYLIPERDELAERAAAVVEAAGWFRGRPTTSPWLSGRNPNRPAVARVAGEPHPRSRRGGHGSLSRAGR